MIQKIVFALLILTACSDRSGTEFKNSKFYEVAKVDYHKNFLQRIFVVIEPEKANDTASIKKILCELEESYKLSDKSNISFFTEKKYANYHTELFIDGENLLPPKEMGNWMNDYYLGEYEFETNQYCLFPASDKANKKKAYNLKVCH